MSSKIYEEAIAEAKHLREVAEQNAKNAIIEAVTPKIREFIDSQLLESGDSKNSDYKTAEDIISDSVGISDDRNSAVSLDESAIISLARLMGSNPADSNILGAIAESINSLGKSEAELVMSATKKLSSNRASLGSSEIDNDVSKLQENSTMRSREKVYDVDLALLKEEMGGSSKKKRAKEKAQGKQPVEETDDSGMFELMGGSGSDKKSQKEEKEIKEMLISLGLLREDKIEIDLGDDVELPEDLTIVARLLADDEEDEEGVEFGDEVMDVEDVEEEEGDLPPLDSLEEVFEIDPKVLKEELLRVRRMLREDKTLASMKGGTDPMEGSWGGKGHANAGLKNAWGGKGSGKAGKGNAFGGGTEKGDVYKVKLNALAESLRKEQRKNRALASRLEQYRGAVETLREQLTDLNLFNAKLLYVNKLFQDKSITPGRRRAMTESIDAAKSLREVKLIYKTLSSSHKDGKKLNESTARSLGSSSRQVSRSSANSASNEVDRWAVLAGIK